MKKKIEIKIKIEIDRKKEKYTKNVKQQKWNTLLMATGTKSRLMLLDGNLFIIVGAAAQTYIYIEP